MKNGMNNHEVTFLGIGKTYIEYAKQLYIDLWNVFY